MNIATDNANFVEDIEKETDVFVVSSSLVLSSRFLPF